MNETTDSGNLLMTASEGDKYTVVFDDGERIDEGLVTDAGQVEGHDRRIVFNNGENEHQVVFVDGVGLDYRVFYTESVDGPTTRVNPVKEGVDDESDAEVNEITAVSVEQNGKDIEYAMENAGL